MINHNPRPYTEEELFDGFLDDWFYEDAFQDYSIFCSNGHRCLEENDEIVEGSRFSCMTCIVDWQVSPSFNRKNIINLGDRSISIDKVGERDSWICQLCFKPVDSKSGGTRPGARSIDHILPLSMGGTHTWENVQLAHMKCNISKGGINRIAA